MAENIAGIIVISIGAVFLVGIFAGFISALNRMTWPGRF